MGPIGNLNNPVKFGWVSRQASEFFVPVQNTLHTILNIESGGARLWWFTCEYVNDENADKDLDCLVTVDGVTHLYDASDIGPGGEDEACAYCFLQTARATPQVWELSLIQYGAAGEPIPMVMYRGSTPNDGAPLTPKTSLLIQYRMTSVVGTNPQVRWKAFYELLEDI